MTDKIFILLLTCACAIAAPSTQSVNLLMPHVQPQEPDTYLCTSLDANTIQPYITEFFPHANMEIAHHILLYGCATPGSKEKVWNCGEMATTTDTTFKKAPVCQTGSKILYAWAMDAPSLNLPPDVAFKVGRGTGVNYLTVQVHYKNVTNFKPPLSETDSSGLTLVTTDVPKGRRAGVYLMLTEGLIPKGTVEYLEAACPYDDIEIHPFAFRTHTHTLGRVVAGYRVRDGQWTEIGRKDPRLPQMFYNATNSITVKKGDILAARCTMQNTLDHDIEVGNTQNDEMCNFYIMYYVKGDNGLAENMCARKGAPEWYLWDYPDQKALNLKAMPLNASVRPGSASVYRANSTGYIVRAYKNQKKDIMNEDELDRIIEQMDPKDVASALSELMENDYYPGYFYPEEFQ